MFDKFKKQADKDAIADRIPPGQTLTKGFPVLTYGGTPVVMPETWACTLRGLGMKEFTFNYEQLLAMPQTTQVCDIHCVTTWSMLDSTWTGVRCSDLLAVYEQSTGTKIPTAATHVMQHCYGGYTTNTSLEQLMDEDVMLAHSFGGAPLELEHGGPVRVLVPKYYFWKSAKWINALEFMASDKLGFWERNGYHNNADPWKEERFSQ